METPVQFSSLGMEGRGCMVQVVSPNVVYSKDKITTNYVYQRVEVTIQDEFPVSEQNYNNTNSQCKSTTGFKNYVGPTLSTKSSDLHHLPTSRQAQSFESVQNTEYSNTFGNGYTSDSPDTRMVSSDNTHTSQETHVLESFPTSYNSMDSGRIDHAIGSAQIDEHVENYENETPINYNVNNSQEVECNGGASENHNEVKYYLNKENNKISNHAPVKRYIARPVKDIYKIETYCNVPKLGVMLVGIGGNNGSTFVGGIYGNKMKLQWETKRGTQNSNYFGSMMMSSTVRIGSDENLNDVFVPLSSLLPMSEPTDWTITGWDISSMKLGDAMKRAQVFDITLQDKLYTALQTITPMKAIYIPHFIASNQFLRADNILEGSYTHQLNQIRYDIQQFKKNNKLDKIIVLWTATTERFTNIIPGVHDNTENLFNAIQNNHSEISPSTLYAVAAIQEGCSYINGSPQNTFVPGIFTLSMENKVFIGGDDFKSGQTKFKSLLVDFLISAGIKLRSVVSYNHLGNNDGYNLSSPQQFRSKEVSKSSLVDQMVECNSILYGPNDRPDHTVVIKYVPYVGDSKRAMDEYISEIFMNGLNTIVIHNTCEDSLLASPLIIDMILLTELCGRIYFSTPTTQPCQMHPVLSILSYFCKAPQTPPNSPIINSLTSQREAILNILKACIGLPPDNNMLLEHKLLMPSKQH